MRDAMPFRELAPGKILDLKQRYMKQREQIASNLYHHLLKSEAAPLPDAWDGLGPIPNSSQIVMPMPPFAAHTMSSTEWGLRVDMAALCRLISRLNGEKTSEGSFAHFSMAIGDGTYLLVPPTMPFGAVRARLPSTRYLS